MPLNTQVNVHQPSAFTIRNHAFGQQQPTGTATSKDKTPVGAMAGADRRKPR